MTTQGTNRMPWLMIGCAVAIMMITTASRQTMGLFVAPLGQSTGLDIVAISLAMAVGQLMWGVGQLGFGIFADRFGADRAIAVGALMVTAGLAMTPFVSSQIALIITLGVLAAAGAGAGNFSVLIGSSSQRIPEARRAFGVGLVSSGSSLGQFVFAPITQALIVSFGWVTAMLTQAVLALLTVPLAFPLRRPPKAAAAAPTDDMTLGKQLRIAFADPSYRWIVAGFFTCGFHIAFLVTHLPGEVNLCGLPASVAANAIGFIGLSNIIGTIAVGWICTRYRMKLTLFWLYAMRVGSIAFYMVAPKTELTMYIFAFSLGLSWLATVPPTAGLVGKLFGTRYLATLFGFAILSHQVGGFLGAWLGGYAVARYGDYTWMFIADALLAALAAVAVLPVKEAKLAPAAAAA